MSKIDHNRPFLRLLNSLERARRRESSSSGNADLDRTDDVFAIAETVNCPLCNAQTRSHKVRHHYLRVHGIDSAAILDKEIKIRSELSTLARDIKDPEILERKICDFIYWLEGSRALLNLDGNQVVHVRELIEVANLRRQGILREISRIRMKINALQNESVDRNAPFRKRKGKKRSRGKR